MLLDRPRRAHTITVALSEPQRYWSAEEHDRFLDAVCLWGCKAAKQISEAVGTRTVTQVRTHMQKWKQRLDAMFMDQDLPSIIEVDVPPSQLSSTSGSNENVAPGGEEDSVSMFYCNESASFLGSESEADELLSLFSFSTPSSPVKDWPLSISLLEAYGEYSG
jgi:SHAQKYF class myb-like DNA-binding protein